MSYLRLPSVSERTPTAKCNLERRLTVKTKELQETREKCSSLEDQDNNNKRKLDKLMKQIQELEEVCHRTTTERNSFEDETAKLLSEKMVNAV